MRRAANKLASFQTDDGSILRETMGRMASAASTHAQSAAIRIKAANANWNEQRAAHEQAEAQGQSQATRPVQGEDGPPPRG